MKLKDTLPIVKRVYLTHPFLGETGGWVGVRGQRNNQYFEQQIRMLERIKELEDNPLLAYQERIKSIAYTCIDWDQEFFGQPFTHENLQEVLLDITNQWIVEAIEKANEEEASFFTQQPTS